MVGMNVDRMLHRMAETVRCAPVAEGSIACDHAVLFADQHRIAHQRARFKPGNTVFRINGGVVPDCCSMQHRVVVNLADGGAIFFAGVTDNHRNLGIGCSL
ncbi:hypothetical protein D3C71_2008070 [compost metagenome]